MRTIGVCVGGLGAFVGASGGGGSSSICEGASVRVRGCTYFEGTVDDKEGLYEEWESA